MNFFTTTSSSTFTQCAPEATEFGEITQNKGYETVHGHSRSPTVIPIESIAYDPPMEGFRWNLDWNDLLKFFSWMSGMAKVSNGVESLLRMAGLTNVTDDRETTDGRTTACHVHVR